MVSEYYPIFEKLAKSKFRSSFKLRGRELAIAGNSDVALLEKHAREILERRVGKKPANDGKQTPWKGYPVFVAQHATATCCRGCIKKFYGIPESRGLKKGELDFFTCLIMEWIFQQVRK